MDDDWTVTLCQECGAYMVFSREKAKCSKCSFEFKFKKSEK